MDEDRWIIEHLLYSHTRTPLWTSSHGLMSLDGVRGTFTLEQAITHLNSMKNHFLFRNRNTRIRNIDTEEIIDSSIF